MSNATQDLFGEGIDSQMDMLTLIRQGISMRTLVKIQDFTKLSNKDMAAILPISERQLARYTPDQVLKKEISSHLIQVVELFEWGYDIFGESKFSHWLRSENLALGNRCPITILDTSVGISIVQDILGRIEHGVFS